MYAPRQPEDHIVKLMPNKESYDKCQTSQATEVLGDADAGARDGLKVHARAHARMQAHAQTRARASARKHRHVQTHEPIGTCAHMHTYACMHTHARIRTHIQPHKRMHVRARTYRHIHTDKTPGGGVGRCYRGAREKAAEKGVLHTPPGHQTSCFVSTGAQYRAPTFREGTAMKLGPGPKGA